MNVKILTITMALILSACTSITETVITAHGYSPTKQDVKSIIVNQTTKQEIINSYGNPFVVGINNPNYWYYISYQTEQYGFVKRKYIKMNIAEIKFNGDVVSFVKVYDKNNLKEISFSSDKSTTSGKELSPFDQIIGNIGKFRPIEKSKTP